MTEHTMVSAKPFRVLHTMIRVADMDRSIAFYSGHLGMKLLRREDYPSGCFSLAFIGFDNVDDHGAEIELTHNWHQKNYELGSAYGHIALAVNDVRAVCEQLAASGVKVTRPPGPMNFESPSRSRPELIAFIEDPDGYRIELIETERQ